MGTTTITFNNDSREIWIKDISKYRKSLNKYIGTVEIFISQNISINTFEPYHIVTLSCLIESIKSYDNLVKLNIQNLNLNEFLWNQVRIKSYWTNKSIQHYDSPEKKDLNIWRILDGYKETYSNSLREYFNRNYFKTKDLSALQNCLNELYQNVFDHADAQGNAFSFIRYIEQENIIKIAVCDFGKGIAATLRDAQPQYTTDEYALFKSLEVGITAKSKEHNRGFGMDNIASILSPSNEMKIVSNKGFLHFKNKKRTPFSLDWSFQGTLVYFSVSIDIFPDKEMLDEFTL